MENPNKKEMQLIEQRSIRHKVINFFKNLFKKKESNNVLLTEKGIDSSISSEKNETFLDSLKIKKNEEKTFLLGIQDEIEKKGISIENIYELTKELTEEQKDKLEKLYIEQINDYEKSIERYKNKILALRKQM